METIRGLQINMRMPDGAKAPQDPPLVVFRATQTKKLPLTQFGGDILIPGNSDIQIDVNSILGNKCTGFILSGVSATLSISINGGAFRTVVNDCVYDDCTITSLRIVTNAVGTCNLQLHGV